ncbi:MAG: helix-turn-helix transcriptional regulator [Duodenibacillus sp.]
MKPIEMLTRSDVARALQVTERTVSNWVRKGRFPAPAMVLGRQRWRAEDVTAYVNKQFRIARDRL